MLGDPVLALPTSCDCEAFIALYASDLASTRGLKTPSVNLGVAGWTGSRLLTGLTKPGPFRDAAKASPRDHPATILWASYWNVFEDGDVGRAKNGESYQSWSDRLTRATNAQICDAAQRAGATCVDLYSPFKGDGSKDPTSWVAADGDHPNSAGHQLIASALVKHVSANLVSESRADQARSLAGGFPGLCLAG